MGDREKAREKESKKEWKRENEGDRMRERES